MAGKGDVSMSTLGSFYDALYELAEKQKQKYGSNAVPDVVPGQITDAIASGIVEVAGSLTGMGELTNFYYNKVTEPARSLFGGWTKPGYSFSPTGIPKEVTTALLDTRDDTNNGELPVTTQTGSDGKIRTTLFKSGVAGKIDVAGPDVTLSVDTANALLLNPNALANSLVDSYWKNKKLAEQVEFIESLGESPNVGITAQYIKNRASGVDKDVASAIAKAQELVWRNNDLVTKRTPSLTGWADPIAQSAVIDEHGTIGDLRDSILGTALAAYGGEVGEQNRADFAKYFATILKEDIVLEYNKNAASAKVDKVYDFEGIFDKVKPVTASESFNGTATGKGNKAQHAFLDALNKRINDPNTPPATVAMLQGIRNKMQNTANFIGVYGELGNYAKGNPDLRGMLKLGVDGLHQRRNAMGLADDGYSGASAGINKESLETTGIQRGFSHAAYAWYRWNKMPTLDKVFSVTGLVTGQTWLTMADMSAGLFSRNTVRKVNLTWGNGSAKFANNKELNGSVLGVKALFDPSTVKRGRTLDREAKKFSRHAITAKKMSLQATTDQERRKWLFEANRYLGLATQRSDALKAHNAFWQGKLGWKPIDVMPHTAFAGRKVMYRMYALSPGAFFGGLLNGDTPQRLMWIGSGFGKHLMDLDAAGNQDRSKWKWYAKAAQKLLNNKAYRFIALTGRRIAFVINLPATLVEEASKRVRVWIKNAWISLIKKLVYRFGAEALYKLAIAAIGVISNVIGVAYVILNAATFGALDKVSKEALRFTMQVILGLILGIGVFIALGFTGGLGGPSYLASNTGDGGTFAPNPGYNPEWGTTYQPPEPTGTPTNPVPTITIPGDKGIDVSHWEGSIDWNTVKKDGKVEFAFIKATEGNDFLDPEFSKNWKNSKSAGIPRSAYHFFLGDIDGKSQAQYFLSTVDKAGGGEEFQLAVDVEWPWKRDMAEKSVAAKNLKEMLDYIEDARGYKPFVYTSYYAWDAMVGAPGWAGDDWPLWVAAYRDTPPTLLPKGWSKWTIWQYTDNGQVAGITTAVDLDVWEGETPPK